MIEAAVQALHNPRCSMPDVGHSYFMYACYFISGMLGMQNSIHVTACVFYVGDPGRACVSVRLRESKIRDPSPRPIR